MMEQAAKKPEVYDFRQYDRIWQRVAPALEPYPGAQEAVSQPSGTELTQAQLRQESMLPGAEVNPCCMGRCHAYHHTSVGLHK